VFLITIGMGIDLRVVWENLGPLAAGVVGVVVIKALVTGLLLRVMGKGRARRSKPAFSWPALRKRP
jgi:CPA2 family monovalent cation:H+ antiporter-2